MSDEFDNENIFSDDDADKEKKKPDLDDIADSLDSIDPDNPLSEDKPQIPSDSDIDIPGLEGLEDLDLDSITDDDLSAPSAEDEEEYLSEEKIESIPEPPSDDEDLSSDPFSSYETEDIEHPDDPQSEQGIINLDDFSLDDFSLDDFESLDLEKLDDNQGQDTSLDAPESDPDPDLNDIDEGEISPIDDPVSLDDLEAEISSDEDLSGSFDSFDDEPQDSEEVFPESDTQRGDVDQEEDLTEEILEDKKVSEKKQKIIKKKSKAPLLLILLVGIGLYFYGKEYILNIFVSSDRVEAPVSPSEAFRPPEPPHPLAHYLASNVNEKVDDGITSITYDAEASVGDVRNYYMEHLPKRDFILTKSEGSDAGDFYYLVFTRDERNLHIVLRREGTKTSAYLSRIN